MQTSEGLEVAEFMKKSRGRQPDNLNLPRCIWKTKSWRALLDHEVLIQPYLTYVCAIGCIFGYIKPPMGTAVLHVDFS